MSSQRLQRIDSAIDPVSGGTKASTLAMLAQAGESVPDGFVISVGASNALDSSDLFADIGDALTDIGARTVAVRSSGCVEDLEDASHAGEYESLLSVDAEASAVIEAARRVVDSAKGTPMAVLVQAMVDAETAGVAFSANPVTGDAEIVVSAVTGLADDLMEGSVTGDEWVIRHGDVLHLGGSAIGRDLVVEVGALAERLAKHFGYPVDIEWAHDGAHLYLLQCRPITALPTQPDIEIPEGSWQKDTTHYPQPVSPMMGSSISIEADALSRWMERSGLILERFNEVSLGGEIYVQPVPIGGGSGKPPPRLVMGIVARLHPELRSRMATAKHLIESGVLVDAPRRWNEEWKPELIGAVAQLRGVDVASLDDRSLLEHIDDVLAFSVRALDVHFDLMLPYMVSIHDLVTACTAMLGWDENRTLRLLSGHSPASSEPTVAMRAVANTIRLSSTAMAALDGPDGELVHRISDTDRALGEAIAGWIDTYGFRSTQYDWSSLTIAEQPGLIGRMIRAQVENETTLLNHDDVEAEARANLEQSDVAEFDSLLVRARDAYPAREDNIPWTYSAPGALLRRAYLEIGSRLAGRDIITAVEDVFMLEHGEAAQVFLSSDDDSLHHVIRRRRAERAWVATHPGPSYLGDPPGAPPDIGAFPAAGRRVNEALLWTVAREFTPIASSSSDDGVITGIPGAAGVHTGTARIVRSEADFDKVQHGDIVICPITNPTWSVLFGIAGAFVCDAGGPLSHTAVLTREYDIPSVLATSDATERIAEGTVVTVDGAAGTIIPATL